MAGCLLVVEMKQGRRRRVLTYCFCSIGGGRRGTEGDLQHGEEGGVPSNRHELLICGLWQHKGRKAVLWLSSSINKSPSIFPEVFLRGKEVHFFLFSDFQPLIKMWQSGSRKQKAASLQEQGLAGDENQWGRNWLERWMAARPWENRVLNSNAKDGVTVGDEKQEPAEEDKANTLNKPKGKVPVSTTKSDVQRQKKGAGHKKSVIAQQTASLESSKIKEKLSDKIIDKVSSKPSNLASRSTSNPKERPAQTNAAAKKRLSLPNNGHKGAETASGGAGKRPTNSSRTAQASRLKNAKGAAKSEPRDQPKPGNSTVKPVETQAWIRSFHFIRALVGPVMHVVAFVYIIKPGGTGSCI